MHHAALEICHFRACCFSFLSLHSLAFRMLYKRRLSGSCLRRLQYSWLFSLCFSTALSFPQAEPPAWTEDPLTPCADEDAEVKKLLIRQAMSQLSSMTGKKQSGRCHCQCHTCTLQSLGTGSLRLLRVISPSAITCLQHHQILHLLWTLTVTPSNTSSSLDT